MQNVCVRFLNNSWKNIKKIVQEWHLTSRRIGMQGGQICSTWTLNKWFSGMSQETYLTCLIFSQVSVNVSISMSLSMSPIESRIIIGNESWINFNEPERKLVSMVWKKKEEEAPRKFKNE